MNKKRTEGDVAFSVDEIPLEAGLADSMFEGRLHSEPDEQFTGGRIYALAVTGFEVQFELTLPMEQIPGLAEAIEKHEIQRIFWEKRNQQPNSDRTSLIKMILHRAVFALAVNGEVACYPVVSAVLKKHKQKKPKKRVH